MTRTTVTPVADGEARKAEAFALIIARLGRLLLPQRWAFLKESLERGMAY